jgi:hypothetical protein
MRRLLVVSPHFPPVNMPDMHRVRTSVPYYAEFGWTPTVLAVDPASQDAPTDQALADALPQDLDVVRVGALPLAAARRVGVGNVALRGLWPMYSAGAQLIRDRRIDAVFFSTSLFPATALGRAWKRKFNVPYVIDLQDPWVPEADEQGESRSGAKHSAARHLNERLEPFAMRGVGGIMAVSPRYVDTIRRRYPWISADHCVTLPFGVDARDLEWAAGHRGAAPPERRSDRVNVVYVGRAGAIMDTSLRILFRAARGQAGQAGRTWQFSFIGTDYAPAAEARPSVLPIAAAEGVTSAVTEQPQRVPFFDGLRAMLAADAVLILGSLDPGYTPSKIAVSLAAGRPIVAILHEASPGAAVLRRSKAAVVVTFSSAADIDRAAAELRGALAGIAAGQVRADHPDRAVLDAYSARELTRRQCEFFDAVLARRQETVAV